MIEGIWPAFIGESFCRTTVNPETENTKTFQIAFFDAQNFFGRQIAPTPVVVVGQGGQ